MRRFTSLLALILLLASHPAVQCEDRLALTEPLEYQIIQRRTKDMGMVSIAGTFKGKATAIEARPTIDGKSDDWQKLDAKITDHTPDDQASPDIRAAQAWLWESGDALRGPDSDALKGSLRENDGHGVHFSGSGLRAHAQRWHDQVAPWLKSQLETR